MKRLFAGLLSLGVLAAAVSLSGTTAVRADERFIPQGFSYRPGDVRLPPINSMRYKLLSEADRREAEIYTRQKGQSDFEDYLIHNRQREQHPLRPGWRYY